MDILDTGGGSHTEPMREGWYEDKDGFLLVFSVDKQGLNSFSTII